MEILPRRQWNLKPPKKFQSIFFFYFFFLPPGFLYQNSKASRWIYWNPELNRNLVPAVAGQNHDYFKTGKEKKKNFTQGLLNFGLQCLIASGHCTLKPWFSPQKTCWFLQRAVIWLHFVCRCVHLQAAALPARPQNAPVSISVIQQCRASRSSHSPERLALLLSR